jgi:hypothetical protein
MPSISDSSPELRADPLDAIRAANRQMAERSQPPPWYHVTLGLLVGGLCAIQEAPVMWRFAYFPFYVVGLILLVRSYRRYTGMWIPGYRKGRTRWVAFSAAGLAMAVFFAGDYAYAELNLRGACVVAGVFVAALVTAAGHAWHWAYRRDIDIDAA